MSTILRRAQGTYLTLLAAPAEDDDLPSMTPAELSIAKQLSPNELSPTTSLHVRGVSDGWQARCVQARRVRRLYLVGRRTISWGYL
ncbi:unnamed protein product [Clonostachys rosea]|uniref:Uncharacterized protein n=1 Tax=Bionectria ochroleuca TaxID=29856 RepID=A0ABY6UKZ5_BIOOC|nr:unnamed protein product [Clonostachys rosea]